MNRTTAYTLVFTLVFVIMHSSPTCAQETKGVPADETVAKVPLLGEFHEVIYKIWHTAWPEKNITMLADLLPQVQRYSDSLANVQLPGILRDKQKVWNESIVQLQGIVADYRSAASPVDSVKILDAAERLHSQYEKLVRITRPALKELDEFHKVLYMLYHHYLPERNQEKLPQSVKELKVRMIGLNAATLPDRLKKREAAFTEARAQLSRAVDALDASMFSADDKNFAASVETVHTRYQALERVFE